MSKAVNSNFFFNSLLAGLVNMSKRKATSAADSSQAKKPKPKGHWSEGLLNAMKDPEKVVLSDDKVCVIKDGFPKAEVHYLVMPKDDIKSLKHVDKSHLELLKHMHSTAEKLTSDEGKRKFLIGYHAEPSMTRLHLHVLSDDMNSPCLKHKKHWNSYTTKFFLKSEDVIKALEEDGKIKSISSEESKKLMNTPIKCHKCSYVPKNIPDLKKHILNHI